MITRLTACRTYLTLIIVVSILALYLLLKSNPAVYPYVAERTSILASSDRVILLWTPFFGIRDYMPVGVGALSRSGCPEPRCEVTADRGRLPESEAVVFHCRDVSVADLPLNRKHVQRWIYYCLESPPHSYYAAYRFMRRMFNWTMSYRLDSDVVTSYGSYGANGDGNGSALQLDVWKSKKKNVVWLVSNCVTSGNREGFVNDLGRHIDVDVFGSCGKERCPNDKLHECLEDYVRDYMFFLALENSLCKDYVTEKFFRILKYDIIPVVYGDANYSRVAPPESYIDALRFKDAKELARHLKNVASNYTLYKSYFKWKERYHVTPSVPLICELCKKLHANDAAPYKVYDDIAQWWVEDSQCRRWRGQ